MATITFTIPDAKLQRVLDAMKGLQEPDPGYTDSQWAKEKVRRIIVDLVQAHEQNVAVSAVAVSKDDAIIS